MKKMIRTVAAAAAVLMAAPALADDDAEETDGAKPLIALELELGFGTDWTFKADDRTAELADAYPDIALAVTINATDWLAFNLGVTVESVLDPVGDRFFGDIGAYVDTLNAQVFLGGLTVTAGKFAPGFGTAWDVTPGVYGADFAGDYELSEALGLGLAYEFKAGAAGTITAGANLFYADNTILSESLFTNRGRNRVGAGGPGNTGKLNNFSVTLDGSDIPAVEGLTWHLGYAHLQRGRGDISDVNAFALGLAYERETGSGWTVGWNGEVVYATGWNGARDKAVYVTQGLSFAKDSWHAELAGTIRQVRYFAGGRDNDLLAQVSAGYEFENGVDVSLGYAFAREAREEAHTLGLSITKTFEYEVAR